MTRALTEWRDSLEHSKAQIAAGETMLLLPVLDQLRATVERLEAPMSISPNEVMPNQS